MSTISKSMDHLLRRAGFGISQTDVEIFSTLTHQDAVARLVDYDTIPDTVDGRIGSPDHLKVVPADTFDAEAKLVPGTNFDPNFNLVDAQQRWVFRMVHSDRPLQEKMTLFWHDHFATGRSKIVEQLSFPGAIRAFATKPDEDPDGATGQIELFRSRATGNFRDLLIAVSQDVAMTCWLDGDTNIVGIPQENFARELMELFTLGVDQFQEEDVYSAARVFTGWNLEAIREDADDVHYRGFLYRPEMHDTGYKQFSFQIYADGGNTIPARDAKDGFQDGVDLLSALAAHPATGEFLSRKLYAYFVNELDEPNAALIKAMSRRYYESGFEIREVLRILFLSDHFQDPYNHWKRYAWPAEYVARLIKEVGGADFTANLAVFGMMAMGQSLYDPPNVAGWRTGEHWFSTTAMLARMNFAMTLAYAEQQALYEEVRGFESREDYLQHYLVKMTSKPFPPASLEAMRTFLYQTTVPWSGTVPQITAKAAGLVHLIGASGEYQFV